MRYLLLAPLLAVLALEASPSIGQPYDLEEVIALALQRNPDLAMAEHRVAEAEAQLGEALSAFSPQLSARLQYARTDNPALAFAMIVAQRRFRFDQNVNRPGPTQDVRPEVSALFPLFRGGQDYFRMRAAERGVEASEGQRAAVRNALVEAASAAYLALLTAPEHVTVATASVAAVDSALAAARHRVEVGAGLRSDVLSLQARLAQAQEAELRARNGVELARAALRSVLALPAEAPLEVRPPVASFEVALDSLPQALERARNQRPELRAAQALVSARENELAAERAAYLPRVDLVGSYGQNATNLKWSSSRDNWFFGASAELDLFHGLRTAQRVRAAEERLAQARSQLENTRLAVELEVQQAFLAWQEARQREQVTRSALAASEEALRLVSEQYRQGAATVTRYLEAEAAHSEAQAREVTARYDARRASVSLRKAMGEWAEGGKEHE